MYTVGHFCVNGLLMLTVSLYSREYVNTVLIDQKTKFTVFYLKVSFDNLLEAQPTVTLDSTYQK